MCLHAAWLDRGFGSNTTTTAMVIQGSKQHCSDKSEANLAACVKVVRRQMLRGRRRRAQGSSRHALRLSEINRDRNQQQEGIQVEVKLILK
ncbi:hypothetical protein E6O75_ATG07827 [Venturia nashicola]|uniref:Uncharacterized protein n=1 Tax=Venturia nashicola TaxID=86259 RepID=A0A4Z1NWN7_9PEZI|nr:hypothetical protein E6O75_ATG07827 [Venturia nashicola]